MTAVNDTQGFSSSSRYPRIWPLRPAGALLLLSTTLVLASTLSAQVATLKTPNQDSDSSLVLLAGSRGEFSEPVDQSQPPIPIRALRGVQAWGLSPEIGSIGPRSGLALVFELDRFAPLFLETGYSLEGSQRHSLGIALGDQRFGAQAAYTFRRDAQDTFWGIGSSSRADQRSDFQRDKSEAWLSSWIPLGKLARLSAGIAFEDNRVDRGHDSNLPDVQDNSNLESFFGVGERTKFLRFDLATTFDFTRQDGFQRGGVWLKAGSAVFRGVDGTNSDFHRFTGEFRGYLPVGSRHMLALRGLFEHNELTGGAGIPFYDLSRLGGTRNGPRGFDGGRFRDRAGLSFMAEWRYQIWQAAEDKRRLQLFVLFDEGGVARGLSRISTSDLRPSYGFGLRLQKRNGLATVGYVAFSEEGTQFGLRTQWPF